MSITIDDDVRDPWWDLVRIVLLLLACVVVARLVGRLDAVLGLTLLAGSVALLTAPVRMRLARRMPSGLATTLTALLTIVAAIAVSALLVRGLASGADQLAGELTSSLDALRPGTLPARVADALDAQASIDEIFSRLPSSVVAGEADAAGVGARAIDLLLVVILAAFLQSSAGSMLDRIVERWPRSGRVDVRVFAADLVARGGGYVRRAFAPRHRGVAGLGAGGDRTRCARRGRRGRLDGALVDGALGRCVGRCCAARCDSRPATIGATGCWRSGWRC